jgi:hypothetical protein
MSYRPTRSCLALTLGAFVCVTGAPLAAQEDAAWTSLAGEGRCELRYMSDENDVLTLAMRGDGSYILSGTAIHEPASDDPGASRVIAQAGDERVLLNGESDEMRKQGQRSGEHPLSLFLEAARANDTVIIVSGGQERTIALTGFAERADEFEACARALMLGEGPRPPVMVGFDGLQQLTAVAQRQRLLTEVIGYTLEVNAEGEPTDCSLDRDFRRRIVTIELCRTLVEHHRFEPARDAEGDAVAGTYSSQIDFRMWMNQRGYLEREERD